MTLIERVTLVIYILIVILPLIVLFKWLSFRRRVRNASYPINRNVSFKAEELIGDNLKDVDCYANTDKNRYKIYIFNL